MEVTEESITVTFPWAVGDRRELEKGLIELVRTDYHYVITVLSRLIALGLTFGVARLLLPGAEVFTLVAIVIVASLSVWVSWGLSMLAFRALERLTAKDPRKVGWNSVLIGRRGVIWSNDVSQEYLSWLGVIDVVEKEGCLWIKTAPAHGYYLPPRLFSSNVELRKCLDLIEDFRKTPHLPIHLKNTDKVSKLRH